jgi:hypothetical protein
MGDGDSEGGNVMKLSKYHHQQKNQFPIQQLYDLLQAQHDSVTKSGFWLDSAEFQMDGKW